MAYTYLYGITPAVAASIADLIAGWRSSRAAFEGFLVEHWGEVRYGHDDFVRDAAEEIVSARTYPLAHELLHRQDVLSAMIDVDLPSLTLDSIFLQQRD